MLSSQMKAFMEGTEFHQCLCEHGPVLPHHQAPSSHQQSATSSTVPVPSLSPSPRSSGASPRSPLMSSLSFRSPHPLLSVSPAQRPGSCRVPPLRQPAVGFVHSQLGIFGAWNQQSQLAPAAQKSEEQARMEPLPHFRGHLHLWSHPACPRLLLPSLGTVCQLPCHELSQQAHWDTAETRVSPCR